MQARRLTKPTSPQWQVQVSTVPLDNWGHLTHGRQSFTGHEQAKAKNGNRINRISLQTTSPEVHRVCSTGHMSPMGSTPLLASTWLHVEHSLAYKYSEPRQLLAS